MIDNVNNLFYPNIIFPNIMEFLVCMKITSKYKIDIYHN